MKISTKGRKRKRRKRKKKETGRNLLYFPSWNWWRTIGSGTEARSYTLYNLSEERRRSGKANYRYCWNKWGNAQSVSCWRMEFLKQSKHAKHFSDEIPGNTSAKHHPIPSQLCPINVRESATFHALLLHECKTWCLFFTINERQ